jgi:hypothetical protein
MLQAAGELSAARIALPTHFTGIRIIIKHNAGS